MKVNSSEGPDFQASRTPYGFDAAVDPIKNKPAEEKVDHITINKLNNPTVVAAQPSMGLPMDKLIIDDTNNQKDQATIEAKFDNLVSNYIPNYDNKFGVQPIPVDLDRSMFPKPIDTTDLHINKDNKPTGRKNNNWFSRIIDQRGEEYIISGKLIIEELSKNAEKIIDDMVSGRIDYDKYGKYIIMPVIIETLINYCSNKLAINRALQFSLRYTYNDYVGKNYLADDPERYSALVNIDDSLGRDITQSIAIVNQDIAIYSILFNRLSYVNTTKNDSSLYSLINELNAYKKQMKKSY